MEVSVAKLYQIIGELYVEVIARRDHQAVIDAAVAKATEPQETP